MLVVCESYVFVCIRMFRMLLVCYSYVTRMYSCGVVMIVSNDGKIPGFCKFLFLSSVIKFDNEMSEVKTKITIAQLLFMQSQDLLSKTRTTLFITR